MKHSLLPLILLAGGCTFVQLSDAGAGVTQLGSGDVAACEHRGEVSSQTKDKVLFNRNKEAVQEELIVLARNEAARLGANAIVPIGEPVGGTQRFRAYACPPG